MTRWDAEKMRHLCRMLMAVGLLSSIGCAGDSTSSQWTQWGGPNRNFGADTTRLADKWPAGGPKKLWNRPSIGHLEIRDHNVDSAPGVVEDLLHIQGGVRFVAGLLEDASQEEAI